MPARQTIILRQGQRGVALITAMLVVSIATLTAVSLASRQNLDIRRTANIMEIDQAYLYTLGIETVAKELLLKYTKVGNHYDDPELMFVPYTFPVENGVVNGVLVDLESKFNVNNLLDEKGKQVDIEVDRFRRLIDIVARRLDENTVSSDNLVKAVLDWLDPDQEIRFPGGAEDGEYLSKEQPYRAGNRMMASASELFLVEGFSQDLLRGKTIEEEFVPGLLNYVTALPNRGTTLSLNTIKPEVLMAISPYIDESNVEQLLAEQPFKDVNAFREQDKIKEIADGINDKDEKKYFQQEELSGFDVESSFFLVDAEATVGRSTAKLNSIIYRDTGGRGELLTISRAQGTDGI
jgi:general secretion pathway protein K